MEACFDVQTYKSAVCESASLQIDTFVHMCWLVYGLLELGFFRRKIARYIKLSNVFRLFLRIFLVGYSTVWNPHEWFLKEEKKRTEFLRRK